MGFLFKKEEVPEELPKLAVDGSEKSASYESPRFGKSSSDHSSFLQNRSPEIQQQMNSVKSLHDFQHKQKDQESGYFKDLIKNIIEGTEDVKQLDAWYKNKFMREDVVFHMREYWEKQQPQLLLQNINGELKTKLAEKTNKLHSLEKEWQQVYFNLITKEEQIRKEEKELKDLLSQFMNHFKQSPKIKKPKRR